MIVTTSEKRETDYIKWMISDYIFRTLFSTEWGHFYKTGLAKTALNLLYNLTDYIVHESIKQSLL